MDFHNLNFKSGVTVANLPSQATLTANGWAYALRMVTDATAPAVGSAPAGGGSAKALVLWDGTGWKVIGV